ncbi:SAM-dependent methyltransferase [Kibdelosporangium banguiense]|uniref:SAM-dependent methyltransferase n=1 Tax=Kibdelosporangium banguiense TaxID=1365924 RepID=A0ABS4T7H1_9PSEU|nr:methyltransferase domain-containing protein [Kibdelosporangium banguiense]MBP2320354.1 SAM-dependent methyltransferase [Kibdelosporangium banguiense]
MWSWDPSLYAGSAAYYSKGRVPYPPELADALATELGLDGSGRLLDVGCGPGSLTLLLAGFFAEAVGVDADQGMIDEAIRLSGERANTRWVHIRAEDLPASLGVFRVVTFAQSFHWMDRARVAATVRGMLEAGGACVHVHAVTHEGVEGADSPPNKAMAELVRKYLGPVRRAGKGHLPQGTVGGESEIYRAAGFSGPQRIEVPGRVVARTTDEVVAKVYSLSSSTPHLFGDKRADFEAELRQLLHEASPNGTFSEQMLETALDIWRP